MFWAIIVCLGLIIVAIFQFRSQYGGGTGEKSSSSVSTDLSTGEIGVLHGRTGTHSVVFLTKEVLDSYFKSKVAGDDYGMNLTLGSDLVFMVRNGTKVRVIDSGALTEEIRILEGEMEGLAGVVPTEWVRSQ